MPAELVTVDCASELGARVATDPCRGPRELPMFTVAGWNAK
jgi:hypothetical protein